MKILIVIKRSPEQRFLVDVGKNSLVKYLRKLIEKKQYSKAIVFAFTSGNFIKEPLASDFATLKVDLILRESGASWDLM